MIGKEKEDLLSRSAARYWALGLVLLLGVAVRLLLLLQWPRRLNPDESTVALMGLHVLRGEFPVFWYSIAYQGAVESYLTAVVYALLGPSPLTAKVTAFLFSCSLIVVACLVGRRMAGWLGGLCCALLVALAPPFLPVFGNYAMMGYMEVVVVGSLVLLVTLDLVTDASGGARRSRQLLILGLLAGLGWWINPMSLSYLAAAGVFLLLSPALWALRGLGAVALGFLLGSLPFWIFNLTHAFWSFVLFRKGTEGNFTAGLRRATGLLLQIAGVRGLLADAVPLLSPAAGIVYLVLLGILFVELGRRVPPDDSEARRRRRGIQIFALFSLFHLTAFSLSGHAPVATSRYLFPLYSSIPVLTGAALLRLWRWSWPLSAGALALLLLNNGFALWKTVQAYETARQTDWWKAEPVVEFLEAEGLTRAYAEIRIAPRLTLEARERVVVANPFDEFYPPYLRWVDAAPRVAWVLARPGDEITPRQFEPLLRGIAGSYERKEFGEFAVYYDFRPPSEAGLASLRPDGWRAEASPPGSDPGGAFDRDADTAWLSGAAITPGMRYSLDLGRAVPVGGVMIIPIRPAFGIPRGYRIEVSRDGTTWDVVASVPEFVATLRWRDGQPRLDQSGQIVSRFAPRPVRYLRVIQTGENPEQWWAIGELFVYGPSTGAVGEWSRAAEALREGIRLEQARRWGPALAAYERAVRLDPELEEAHWRSVEVYRQAGLPVAGSDPERRAQVFERLGLWERAAREYEILVGRGSEDGQHSEPLSRLLEIYRRQGQRDQAERVERRLREEYAPPTRAEARFGRAVRLLGYGLAPREARAGEEVELAYYWQGLKPIAEDLTVFVHFIRDGRVRFVQDHEPLDGRYPTSRWGEGELVRERYGVRLPEGLPAGEYEVRVGLWNPKTGKRAPVETSLPHSGDQVQLTTLRVLPPR